MGVMSEKYEVGFKLVNPESKDASVFAGYDVDGNETWCDIGITDWGREALCPPETKTFICFNGSWSRWSENLDSFAENVDTCH
jgi:hypothetical protein